MSIRFFSSRLLLVLALLLVVLAGAEIFSLLHGKGIIPIPLFKSSTGSAMKQIDSEPFGAALHRAGIDTQTAPSK